MIKSASPVAVLITNFAWGLRPISLKLLSIVALISIGICIASYGELAFSTLGFVLQCVAIIVEANRVVLIQMLLQGEGMTPITTLYFFAPASPLSSWLGSRNPISHCLVVSCRSAWRSTLSSFYPWKDGLRSMPSLSSASSPS